MTGKSCYKVVGQAGADHELHILLSLKKIGYMCKIPFCKCGHTCGSIRPKADTPKYLFIFPEIEQDEYILIEQSLNKDPLHYGNY